VNPADHGSTVNIHYSSIVSRVAWPAPLAPSASNRLATLYQLEQSQWWTPEALLQAQFSQLRELVPYAARHVPHYASTLGGLIEPGSVTPEAWARIPLLSRKDLQTGGQALVSRQVPRDHGKSYPNKTSGSTGIAVEFMTTDLSDFFWKVFCLREHMWHRRDFTKKLMAIRFIKDPSVSAERGLQATAWGAATDDVVKTGPASLYDLRSDASFLVDRLLEEQPGYLLSHPSLLAGMVELCERRGVRPQGLIELRSLGESLPDDLRESCQRVLGVPLVDMYTCQEAGYLANQCPKHPHYHVQSENVLLEVLDAQGQPCQPGEIGRVVITTLHNFATPLIRYDLGDCAEVGEPCDCGRGLPVLKRIMGRYRNLVTLPSGELRWPKMGYEELRSVVPVDLMQMVQHSLEDIEVRLVKAAPLTAEEQQALTAFIQRNLGYPFRLRFEYVADIRNASNGKIEQFISKLPNANPYRADPDPPAGAAAALR
jgi:phenylacetate-CoA ligase